jgi:hypothetical protein
MIRRIIVGAWIAGVYSLVILTGCTGRSVKKPFAVQGFKKANQINMNNRSFTTTILVQKTAGQAYEAIKNFRGWWSEEIEGNTDRLNETFFYHYKDIHLCKLKLIEMEKDRKLVYKVIDNEFNFVKDKTEWVNTQLVFDIIPEGEGAKITFTHQGLVPDYECYQVCNDAWTGYITKSLRDFIETGKGAPNPKDKEGFNAQLAKKWGLH